MLRFYYPVSLLELLCFFTIAHASEVTQNVSDATPSTATVTAVPEANDTTEVWPSERKEIVDSKLENASPLSTSRNADTVTFSEPSANSLTESTTETAMTTTTTTKLVQSQVTLTNNSTTSIASNTTNSYECTIRVGFFWWKKVRIPVKRIYFNTKKCELKYCTPSLKVESFTCKNLLALMVPPDSTEELVNEWKLECTKHQCVPTF